MDTEKVFKKTWWTQEEDDKLMELLEAYKYTYNDISKILNRSEAAIIRRLTKLKIKCRPVRYDNKKWTDKEISTMLSMQKEGRTWEEIGKVIGKNGLSVRGKFKRMEKESE